MLASENDSGLGWIGNDYELISLSKTGEGLLGRIAACRPAELDNDRLWNLDTILYVGCSRARNHLILLTAADLSDTIQVKLG